VTVPYFNPAATMTSVGFSAYTSNVPKFSTLKTGHAFESTPLTIMISPTVLTWIVAFYFTSPILGCFGPLNYLQGLSMGQIRLCQEFLLGSFILQATNQVISEGPI